MPFAFRFHFAFYTLVFSSLHIIDSHRRVEHNNREARGCHVVDFCFFWGIWHWMDEESTMEKDNDVFLLFCSHFSHEEDWTLRHYGNDGRLIR